MIAANYFLLVNLKHIIYCCSVGQSMGSMEKNEENMTFAVVLDLL